MLRNNIAMIIADLFYYVLSFFFLQEREEKAIKIQFFIELFPDILSKEVITLQEMEMGKNQFMENILKMKIF